ncbi:MAG: hypothetical protein VW455_12025 [Nitrospinota bacterium]
MKTYTEVKKITVLVAMFLAGFLVLANGALAGSNHFEEEMAVKGITENAEHRSGLGTGEKGLTHHRTFSSPKMRSNVDHFVEERAAKGIADKPEHIHGLGTGEKDAVHGNTVFPSTRDTYKGLFDEERMVKGIHKD